MKNICLCIAAVGGVLFTSGCHHFHDHHHDHDRFRDHDHDHDHDHYRNHLLGSTTITEETTIRRPYSGTFETRVTRAY